MVYLFNRRTLDKSCEELRRGDALISLERKVFEVLVHLLEHRDRLVGKQELLERLWTGVAVEQGAVARCVSMARRAVGDNGRRQRIIRTIHGRGYRFVAPVETQAPQSRDRVPARREARATAVPAPGAPLASPALASRPATALCGMRLPPPIALDLDTEWVLVERLAGLLGDVARPYGGTVQHLGSDGFSVMFGAPCAQEDHAHRAVLAALAIRQRWPASIGRDAVALGLHTSMVALVDPGETAPPGMSVVVGEAGSRAAEMARAAAPGTIVMTDAVRRLVGDFFECAPLGPGTARDSSAPSARHRVLGEAAAGLAGSAGRR